VKTWCVPPDADGEYVWRMEDVLHAMDHGGTVGALGDVDDALQAQEIAAAVLGQGLEQERQCDGSDRFLAQDGTNCHRRRGQRHRAP